MRNFQIWTHKTPKKVRKNIEGENAENDECSACNFKNATLITWLTAILISRMLFYRSPWTQRV